MVDFSKMRINNLKKEEYLPFNARGINLWAGNCRRDCDDEECEAELITDNDDNRFPMSIVTNRKLDMLINAVGALTWAVKSVLVSNGTVGINKLLNKVTTYTEGKTEVYILTEVIENIDAYISTTDVLDYRHKMMAGVIDFIAELWEDNPKGFKAIKRFIKREFNADAIGRLMTDSDYDFEDIEDLKYVSIMLMKCLQRQNPEAANRVKCLFILGDAIKRHIDKLKASSK